MLWELMKDPEILHEHFFVLSPPQKVWELKMTPEITVIEILRNMYERNPTLQYQDWLKS